MLTSLFGASEGTPFHCAINLTIRLAEKIYLEPLTDVIEKELVRIFNYRMAAAQAEIDAEDTGMGAVRVTCERYLEMTWVLAGLGE